MTRTVIAVTVEAVHNECLIITALDPNHKEPRSAEEVRPRYWADDRPNCLVGNILTKLGFASDVLKQLDDEYELGSLIDKSVRIGDSHHPALAGIDDKAMAALTFLQDSQDAGYTWSQCYDGAFADKSWYTPVHLDRAQRPWLY